jgi:hypothetical protein
MALEGGVDNVPGDADDVAHLAIADRDTLGWPLVGDRDRFGRGR